MRYTTKRRNKWQQEEQTQTPTLHLIGEATYRASAYVANAVMCWKIRGVTALKLIVLNVGLECFKMNVLKAGSF